MILQKLYTLLLESVQERTKWVIINEPNSPRLAGLLDQEVILGTLISKLCQLEQSSPPLSPPTAPADSAVVLLPHGSQPREFRLSMGELSLVLDFIRSVREFRLTGEPFSSKIEQRTVTKDGSICILLHIEKPLGLGAGSLKSPSMTPEKLDADPET